MSHPLGIMEDISEENGMEWNEQTMLEIATDYIDAQMDNGAFRDYVIQRLPEKTIEENDK